MVVQLGIDQGELATLFGAIIQKEIHQFKEEILDSLPRQTPLMDVCELAEYLAVSKDWIYKKVQEKLIPHTKVGSAIRFHRVEVDRWLEIKGTHVLAVDPVADTLRLLAQGTEDS